MWGVGRINSILIYTNLLVFSRQFLSTANQLSQFLADIHKRLSGRLRGVFNWQYRHSYCNNKHAYFFWPTLTYLASSILLFSFYLHIRGFNIDAPYKYKFYIYSLYLLSSILLTCRFLATYEITTNTDTVKYSRDQFGFKLPSELITYRRQKFSVKLHISSFV